MWIFHVQMSASSLRDVLALNDVLQLCKREAILAGGPADVLCRVNRALVGRVEKGQYARAYCVELVLSEHRLKAASAGHGPMSLWKRLPKREDRVNPNGIALGVEKGPVFERTIKEETITLDPGDRFTLYSDEVVATTGDENLRRRNLELADRESWEYLRLLTASIGDPLEGNHSIVTARRTAEG